MAPTSRPPSRGPEPIPLSGEAGAGRESWKQASRLPCRFSATMSSWIGAALWTAIPKDPSAPLSTGRRPSDRRCGQDARVRQDTPFPNIWIPACPPLPAFAGTCFAGMTGNDGAESAGMTKAGGTPALPGRGFQHRDASTQKMSRGSRNRLRMAARWPFRTSSPSPWHFKETGLRTTVDVRVVEHPFAALRPVHVHLEPGIMLAQLPDELAVRIRLSHRTSKSRSFGQQSREREGAAGPRWHTRSAPWSRPWRAP